jgi:hypothetical protein
MKIILLFLLFQISLVSQVRFSDYFEAGALRFDYLHIGDNSNEKFVFDEIRKEPYFSGSKTNLIDTLFFGNHFFKVFDSKTKKLIYSRGFSSLFQEWQSTIEAKEITRFFSETLIFPFPKNDVILKIYSRDKTQNNQFIEKFSFNINPSNYFIKPGLVYVYDVEEIKVNNDSNVSLDIAFLPDGYTETEMPLFIEKVKELSNYLFEFEPFTSYKDKINIWAVLAPSIESGTDIPRDSVWVSTVLNSSFYTLNSERYLMTQDIKRVRDVAANVPYDQIMILVNTEKYGGGAIYNYYSMTCSNNSATPKVFIHEFGHGFAGLADEYGNDPTYIDYYSSEYEPWEPNITTLANFKSKWKDDVDADTPIPTPFDKEYRNKLGAFEGAGYADKGVYRPTYNSLMRTLGSNEFNKPSRDAIEILLKMYTK